MATRPLSQQGEATVEGASPGTTSRPSNFKAFFNRRSSGSSSSSSPNSLQPRDRSTERSDINGDSNVHDGHHDGGSDSGDESELDDGESRGLLQAVALSVSKAPLGRPFLTPEDENVARAAVEQAFRKLNIAQQSPTGAANGSDPGMTTRRSFLYQGRDTYSSSSSSDTFDGGADTVVADFPTTSYKYAYRRQSMVSASHRSLSRRFKKSPSRKMTLFALSMVNLTAYLTMSIIAPFFPYEASLKGMNSSLSGFVFSVYALVMMVASPLLGKVLPLVGIKFMLLSGIWLNGCANVLFGVLGHVEDELVYAILCFVVRSVAAFGAASFSTASYTYIIQLFPDNVGLAFGLTETCVGVGMSLGPAVGGLLYGLGGFELPFYVLGGFVLLNVPICWYYVKPLDGASLREPKRPRKSTSKDISEPTLSYSKMLRNPRVLVLSLVLATATSTQGYLDPTVEPHFRDYGLTPEYVGLVFLVMSAAYAISSPFGGWLANKVHDKSPLMVAGLVLTALGYLLLGPSDLLGLEPDLAVSTSAMLIIGLAYSLAFIPTFEAILDCVVEGGAGDDVVTYSLVSGWWSCFNNLGELAGASLGGVFLDAFGFIKGTNIVALYTTVTAGILAATYITRLVLSSQCRLGGDSDPERTPLLDKRKGLKESMNIPCDAEQRESHDICDVCEESVSILGRLSAFRHKKASAWRKNFLLTL